MIDAVARKKCSNRRWTNWSDLLSSLEGHELPAGLCLYDGAWHQGIVGLVASRIKDSVHRPVLAFAPESEGSRCAQGFGPLGDRFTYSGCTGAYRCTASGHDPGLWRSCHGGGSDPTRWTSLSRSNRRLMSP